MDADRAIGTQCMQWNRDRRTWCGVVALTVIACCGGLARVEARSHPYRVAVLTLGWTDHRALERFRERLTQLGYREGQEVAYTIEDVHGDTTHLADRAARLVATAPDLILTIGTAPAVAMKQATTTLPILFTFVADPLQAGLIESYASSKNNVTGIATSAGLLSGKRLELLKEIAPGTRSVLVLVAPHEQVSTRSFELLIAAAPKLGIQVLRQDVTSKEDIEQCLKALPSGAVAAIFHGPSALVGTYLEFLIAKAKEARLPLSVPEMAMVERGALFSYGADLQLLGMQAAILAAKIFQGEKPAEIPIQTPEQFRMGLNLSTAKAIGLTIPPSILERVERLIE